MVTLEDVLAPELVAYFRSQVGLDLPFRDFGYSGGYGPTRRALVDAIRDNDGEQAWNAFLALVGESIEEMNDEE